MKLAKLGGGPDNGARRDEVDVPAILRIPGEPDAPVVVRMPADKRSGK